MLDPITEYIIFKDDVRESLSEFSLPGIDLSTINMSSPATTAISLGVVAAGMIFMIVALEKEMKKTPRCKNIKTQPEFDICRLEEYIKIYQKEITAAKSKMAACAKDKKPEKCRKILTKIIERAQKQINSRKKSLVKLYAKKKEKDIKRKK